MGGQPQVVCWTCGTYFLPRLTCRWGCPEWGGSKEKHSPACMRKTLKSQVFSPESRDKSNSKRDQDLPRVHTPVLVFARTYVRTIYINWGIHVLVTLLKYPLLWNKNQAAKVWQCLLSLCRTVPLVYSNIGDICSLLIVSKNDSTTGTYRVGMNSYKTFILLL
jgi:hypothetical protein